MATEINIMNIPEGYQSIISNARKKGWSIQNVRKNWCNR